MNKTTLDFIENITIDDSFPIKNLHALNYLREGLYFLAISVRREEFDFFKETEGNCTINTYGGIKNHSLLMNMFNWFSIDIINYLRLIALVDFVNKNNINIEDINLNKRDIKSHCKEYVEKLIPEILIWRNKLSAHHSITDPKHDDSDNFATFQTSTMNNIIYRNPYYQAGGVKYYYDSEETAIIPWNLTEIYESLSSRFWPELKLEQFPKKDEITGLFRVVNQENFLTREELIEKYNDIIDKNINTNNEKILEQVAQTYSKKGELLIAMNEDEKAILNYNELNNLIEKTKNLKVLFEIARGIFGTALIYSRKNMIKEEIEQYEKCIKLFKSATNDNILLIVLDCYLNKTFRYSKPGMNHKITFETFNEALELIENIDNVKNKKEFVLIKAKILINNVDLLIRWKSFENAIILCDKILDLGSLSDGIILEKNKARALKDSIINN